MISQGRRNKSSERSTSRERRHHGVGRVRNGEHLDGRSQILHQQDRKRYRSRSRSEPRSADRRDQDQTIQRARAEDKDHKRRRHRIQSTLSANSRDQQKPARATRDHLNSRYSAPPDRDRSEDDQQTTPDAYGSDPLEMLVGPLERPKEKASATEKPPVQYKGRGAYRPSGAAMDAHFSSDYNPGLDLHPESELEDEKDDWDMALEALRDREMFKQKHAERLREAGFDDAEIKKWEDSGKRKDVADVKWAARGEAREWDLGKEDQD
jgi:hypothetical protein